MSSYEKPGKPGDRDLSNQDENFPIRTLQPELRFRTQHGGQNSIIFVLYVFPL